MSRILYISASIRFVPIFSNFQFTFVDLPIRTNYAVKIKLISISLNYVNHFPFVLVPAALRAKGRQLYYLDNLRQLIQIAR